MTTYCTHNTITHKRHYKHIDAKTHTHAYIHCAARNGNEIISNTACIYKKHNTNKQINVIALQKPRATIKC